MEQPTQLDALFVRAKDNGIAMAEICRRANVDPTTPSRWRRGLNGATLDRLQKLEGALDAIIGERSQAAA